VLCSTLRVAIANASFQYGFEYLGVGERLVQTPLTDRCFLTLTQALSLRLGGNPFGPAGTGKTETVKALGGQLGRFVLVFNCDEHFDFKAMSVLMLCGCASLVPYTAQQRAFRAMPPVVVLTSHVTVPRCVPRCVCRGRIFVGLAQVGAWGCFDEFNRLEERILSAVSAQILAIQTALLKKVGKWWWWSGRGGEWEELNGEASGDVAVCCCSFTRTFVVDRRPRWS
jgi:dynein heavy chain 1